MAKGKKGRESGLRAVPLERKDANDFVARLHRHHDPVNRDKYRIGCVSGD